MSELINAVVLTIKSDWKPRFYYKFSKLREMFSFCIWSMGESFSSWLVSNLGIFIIGTTLSEYYLGVYKTATTSVNQIISIITASTISVLIAGLSSAQNNPAEFKKIYYSFLKGIGILTIPLGVGILMYDDLVCSILLGSQWKDATIVIGVWGFVLAESVIFNGMSGAVIISVGRPRELFISNISQAIVMIPAFFIGSKYGFEKMVIITTIVRIELPAIQTLIMCRVSNIHISEVISVLKKYIIATIIMGVTALVLKQLYSGIIYEIVSVIICVATYFGILFIIPEGRNEMVGIYNTFKDKISRGKINGK